MIPSLLAKQLKVGLSDYLETTFPMSNYLFKGSLSSLIEKENAVFHEPYISVKLPFRVVDNESATFQAFKPKFKPYLHQDKAYQRLTGNDGRSTLVATGTGSGKTECFLYPVLEYCYQHRGEAGIKALIIYPMNALATDQAKRIAEEIYNSPNLRGNITAGMYVGGYEENASRFMTKDRIITDKETMLANPPDILLTNYKMLDYLLVRPKDSELWKENNPETLKYVVVDELHTFDGAQGTDLACLLRRLKARLYTQQGYLCCVGTSATMGSEDSSEYIRQYASSIFGEEFEDDSVITEDRLSAEEFFLNSKVKDFTFPSQEDCEKLIEALNEGEIESYLEIAVKAWFNDSYQFDDIMSDQARLELSEHLMGHNFLQALLHLIDNRYIQPFGISEELTRSFPEIQKLGRPEIAYDAIFALISHARIGSKGKLRPFLNVQVQFWMRELRRLLAKVSAKEIDYALAADLNDKQAKEYLPIINCRDCGETGWVSILNERNNISMVNLDTFYNLFFSYDEKIKMIYPSDGSYEPSGTIPGRLCPSCLQLHLGEGKDICSDCGTPTMLVLIPINNVEGRGNYKRFTCPFCGSKHGLSLMGLRSATAISATSSQIFSSKFNDDKKLLAFSDNVQDAAHRAGFFNARTWKFGLRSAIQKFALEKGDGLPLDSFENAFIAHWKGKYPIEDFLGFFTPPNMTWMRAFETLENEGKIANNAETKLFIANVERRVKYEILLEYGISSRIGRTLEKTGSSVIAFESSSIRKVAEGVRDRSVNELGELKDKEIKIFEYMVIGTLNILKSKGAFNDYTYNIFTLNDGKTYLLSNDKNKWMPGTHSNRNIPSFPYKMNVDSRNIKGFDLISRDSIYSNWIEDCINIDSPGFYREDISWDLSKIIIEELVKRNFLTTMESKDNYTIYALNKSSVAISTRVSQFTCNRCGTNLSVAEENQDLWIGAPCIRKNCGGNLYLADDQSLEYYGKLYSQGNMVRIVASEHTGLLNREKREELEERFKAKENRKVWDPNLLSSTPTLEMGIDIGDLSTVVLSSMPPGQTQFLQRTGRAGRTDGNSLTLVVANARPHDLYFYAEPMEMMQGIVMPPKIFLRASAVLERQFVAYCLDSWIKRDGINVNIPEKVGRILKQLSNRPKDMFPFNFLLFVQSNLSSLIRTFILMFSQSKDSLDKETIEELERFVKGDGINDSPMHLKILEAFESLKLQKEAIQNNIKQLRDLIKEIESRPADSSYEEEIKDLKGELYGLLNVVKNINNKNIFNFMSDEGLLPNYAFPEAGIILKAILFRKEEDLDDEKKKYEKMIFEYNRSVSSALSEFAPSNNFYVDGKRLEINQVDLNTAEKARWRLCPNCSYIEEVSSIKNVGACPRCGSPAWADEGQVRTMLKVKMVYSNMPYKQAYISDESDDRTSTFYLKQMLVDVDEDRDIVKAYQMDNEEFSFGYEFVRKATLREINFGERDIQGEKITVSGLDEVRKGFKICKFCGRIQDNPNKENHSFACKANKRNSTNIEPFEECLFIYREFTTEILRILIPSTSSNFNKTRQESFIAAFMLGMKEYFGNVDHLRATLSEVPVIDADFRKQYLVIFDSVPGGTGYLKQLLQQDNALIDIFEHALDVMENCNCKEDSTKDGCYRCLFAYRQSRNLGEISRRTAIEILRTILSGKENLKEIEKLDIVPVNSLFESELERMFIQALELLANESRKIHIEKSLVNLKEGYLLKVGDKTWEIEPQVELGLAEGVSVETRADFVFWPRNKNDKHKPIAIYTDGFKYHKDKVDDDTLKREALRRSNNFRVWSFSWKDIESVFKQQGDYFTHTLAPERFPSGPQLFKPTLESKGFGGLDPDKIDSTELFMRYLEADNAEELFKTYSQAYSLSFMDMTSITKSSDFNLWNSTINKAMGENALLIDEFKEGETIHYNWRPRNKNVHISILAGISIAEFKEQGANALPIVCAILEDKVENRGDKYEADWNGFWHFYNMMQFSSKFMGLTNKGIEDGIYSAIKDKFTDDMSADYIDKILDNNWKQIFEQLFEEEAIEMANKLCDLKIEIPSTVGYELTNSLGSVVGECELAWEEEKIAFLLKDQLNSKKEFSDRGWTTFTSNEEIPILLRGGN